MPLTWRVQLLLVLLACACQAACGIADPEECGHLLDEMVGAISVAERAQVREIHAAACPSVVADPALVDLELTFTPLVVNPDHLSMVLGIEPTSDEVIDGLPPLNGVPVRSIFDLFLRRDARVRAAGLASIYARFAAGDPRLHYNHLATTHEDLELWRGSERIARLAHRDLRDGRARVTVQVPAVDIARLEQGEAPAARWLLRAETALQGPTPPYCVQNVNPRARALAPGESTCFTRFDTLSELVHVDPGLRSLIFGEIGASYACNEWVSVGWRRP